MRTRLHVTFIGTLPLLLFASVDYIFQMVPIMPETLGVTLSVVTLPPFSTILIF
jgi:hypothetical protein